ncbi:MAG: ketopantoate reductase family protein [Deltaproteobacteria bacterium]|nr:ketopantoate reductase family protein [Deltaproteobacteria bacterium]
MTSKNTRLIMVGVGAVGGSLAAELALAGLDVIVVARGDHYQRIQERGLHYLTPHREQSVSLTSVENICDLTLTEDDAVVLATKIADVAQAAEEIAKLNATLPVLCLQNGVAGEHIAAQHLEQVYAGMVYISSTYLEAGRVENYSSNAPGALCIGPHKNGTKQGAEGLAETFARAGFNATACDDVMPWKYGKLLTNLTNALEACCSDIENTEDLNAAAIAEGETCYRAAGITYLTADELVEDAAIETGTIAGKHRPGGSMWQSVARGRPPEVDYLNGEIARLGRAHGVPTPINSMLVAVMHQSVRDGILWTSAGLRARMKLAERLPPQGEVHDRRV